MQCPSWLFCDELRKQPIEYSKLIAVSAFYISDIGLLGPKNTEASNGCAASMHNSLPTRPRSMAARVVGMAIHAVAHTVAIPVAVVAVGNAVAVPVSAP